MDAEDQRRRRSRRPSYQHGFDDDDSHQITIPSSAGSARTSQSAAIGPRESFQHVGIYGYAPSQRYPSQQSFGPAYTYPPDYSQHPGQRGLSYSQNPQPTTYYSVDSLPQAHNTHNLPLNEQAPFQQRHSSAIESLPHQHGAVQYYNPGVSQASLVSDTYPYASSGDFGQTQVVPGHASGDPGLQHMSGTRQPQQQAPPDPSTSHDQLLRQVNTFTSHGRLVEARPLLIRLSTNLVDHVPTLGTFSSLGNFPTVANFF